MVSNNFSDYFNTDMESKFLIETVAEGSLNKFEEMLTKVESYGAQKAIARKAFSLVSRGQLSKKMAKTILNTFI